jgi:hypothetical protein
VPSATLAVEHYNRLVRLLAHGQPVRMEVNIQTKFHQETNPEGNAFNIIAEIPGTDLANEVVIMGAHFDTYPYATGSTDNTTGSSAMIEALRVIQKLGLKPRRTIRLCLWAAEEQGLLGSREYVARHFFDSKTKTPKPGHENVQAYFNLDNGTGRILGIWGRAIPAMKQPNSGTGVMDLGWNSPRSVTGPITGHSKKRAFPASSSSRSGSLQLAHAPLEHGHVDLAQKDVDPAGRGGRGVWWVRGERAGAPAKEGACRSVTRKSARSVSARRHRPNRPRNAAIARSVDPAATARIHARSQRHRR